MQQYNNRVPVETVGQYVICFEATRPYEDMRDHFINDCGWSEEEVDTLDGCQWFDAEVSIWKNGEYLAAEYLGANVYDRISDFYTEQRGGYYEEMRASLLDWVARNPD